GRRVSHHLIALGVEKVIFIDYLNISQLGVANCTTHVGNPTQCHCSSEPAQLRRHSREDYNASYARTFLHIHHIPFCCAHSSSSRWCTVPLMVFLLIEEGQVMDLEAKEVLILNTLANRGQASPPDYGDRRGRRIRRIHTLFYLMRVEMTRNELYHYTTIENELLAIIILGPKIVVFSDHAELKYLLKKPDAKPRLIWWMLLLQEFDVEIRDMKGAKNAVVDHLCWLEKDAKSIPI
ncbi:Retrovirus-related Pol polyprotein from transposon 17.6, partial [Mucuna pruriens]